jgi:hypothetical protein
MSAVGVTQKAVIQRLQWMCRASDGWVNLDSPWSWGGWISDLQYK